MLSIERISRIMQSNAERIHALVESVSGDQARWKPDAGSWSVLEVVNHLADEEREDFRVRLDAILHTPGRDWPPIDPRGWVTERRYNERDLRQSLDQFAGERRKSVTWLLSLELPDWDAAVDAPVGRIRAGDMMASWMIHDLLHLRQLVNLECRYMEHLAHPYNVDYAAG